MDKQLERFYPSCIGILYGLASGNNSEVDKELSDQFWFLGLQ